MSLLAVNTLKSISRRSLSIGAVLSSKGDYGSGVGKGGGAGGAIREAGGKFGEIEAAAENVYFRKLEAQQLEALRKRHDEEIHHHEKEIQRHLQLLEFHNYPKKDAIKRHREHQKELKNEKKDD